MSIPFYRAFEDRYRGSRELVHERQQIYIPFLEPLAQLYPECLALDLGCGRGEWLEILSQQGFKPLGVDLDTGMLEGCYALGLRVEKGDALEKLKSLPDESQSVISGFHIAEHLPFEYLKVVVAEALRVLKPAGLLILETPNAENLVVGTQDFYLDPTHERPIPHLLLSFLAEYSGFTRSLLLRLQEPAVLAKGGRVDLMSVLHGVSPDYAVIAQKQALPEQLEVFDSLFARDYGLSLETLARRYDAQLAHWMKQGEESSFQLREQLNHVQQHSQQLEAIVHEQGWCSDDKQAEVQTQLREISFRAEQAESRCQNLELRLNDTFGAIERVQVQIEHLLTGALIRDGFEQSQAQNGLQELNARLNTPLKDARHWRLQANAYEAQIAALVNSKSWRITKPLRTLSSLFGLLIRLPARAVKRIIRPFLVRSMQFVLSRPGLRLRLRNCTKLHPKLYERMRQFALHHRIIQPRPNELRPITAPTEAAEDGFQTASPRVARVYSELKLAFERKENR